MARGIGIYQRIGLILIQVCSVISYVQGDKFEFVKCIWDGSQCSWLEQVSNQPDIEEMVSKWPPGPYAIPKAVDGCPETKLQGWEEGYIDITWQQPHVIFSRSESTPDSENDADTSKQFKDVTHTKLPSVQSFMLGPYSMYRIKLNFCFKTSRNETLDIDSWPRGNYSIYGAFSGCPDGFSSEMASIQLGKVSFFVYDGHLPGFKLNKRDQHTDYLEVRLCTHNFDDDHGVIFDNIHYENPFIFLSSTISPQANQNLNCPSLTNMRVVTETLYLRPNDGSSNLTQLLCFCYFQPETWIHGQIPKKEYAKAFLPEGIFVVRTSAITGQVSLKSPRVSDRHRDIADTLSNEFGPTTHLHWKLLDIGRTLSIFGILLQITVWPVKDETSGEYLRCYYSERQWDFLHFAAQICSFSVKNNLNFDSSVKFGHLLEMKRVTEGRYLTFLSGSQDMVNNVLDNDIEMIVLTTYYSHLTDQNARCNIDLGMTDYGIDDFQISASSSLPEFAAVNARPLLSSWCADVVDPLPFILVDLYRTMKIEGITIWNLEHIFEIVTDGTLYKSFISTGVRSFSMSYGETEDNLALYVIPVFKLNLLYPVDEPQSFMFAFPFNARFVKVNVLEPLAHNLSCLRFELHGCRKTGINPLECTTSRIFKRVPTLNNLTTHPGQLFKNLTLNECNDLCINKTECCLLQSLPNGDCLHFESNYGKNSKLKTTEANSDVWYAKVCISDYIVSPYVAYTITHYRLYYMNVSILTYLSIIKEATILTSIGFPFGYGASENYKWAISFDETDFIKLIFTAVNFNVYTQDKKTSSCQDQLIFNEERNRFNNTEEALQRYSFNLNTFLNKKGSFIIDNTFNGKTFATETDLSQLTLTFVSCLHTYEVVHKGNGFRAIVNKHFKFYDLFCYSIAFKLL